MDCPNTVSPGMRAITVLLHQNAGLWKAEQMREYLAAFCERTEYISAKLPELTGWCNTASGLI